MSPSTDRSPPVPSRSCPRCGAALSEGAGGCPRCLLELGLPRSPELDEEQPAGERAHAGGIPSHATPSLEEVREAFPELEVEALLGRGGMGAVFKARQKKLERTVALKVLPRGLGADPAFTERFLREARALARLAHPGIVTVHDFGESGGLFFLVMEFVDGVDLRRLMRAGPIAPRQALSIARDLCDALQFAHDEGVVHRDIKPENVLVDARGRVKVADFGLAKLVDPAAGAFQSRTDQVMGTPHYMAPEQLERPREVDHRADLFSLGVVMYEMLTGSLPRGNFEPPSRRVEVDVRLDEIVLKALEREPERRYQQALEVKSDVDQVTSSRAAAPSENAGPERAQTAAPGDHATAGPIETAGPRRGRGANARAVPRRDPFRGARALVLLAAMWIAFAALWNAGPFAFGAGFALAGIVIAVITDGRLRSDPELKAALDAEPRLRRAVGLFGMIGPLVGGLLAIAAGHYFHWERGTSTWTPAYRGLLGAFEAWRNDPFGLLRISGPMPAGVEPMLVMSKSYTTGSGETWGLISPWLLIGAGFVLLALAITQATHVREPEALRRRSWHLGAEIASLALGVLVVLWIAAPLVALRGETALSGIERRFEVGHDLDETRERLHRAFVREEYHVDVDQRLAVRDRRTGEEILRTALQRAQTGSPFERFTTSFEGARRATPQIWATLVPLADGQGTTVLLRAGLYDTSSDEGEGAERALTLLQAAMREE